MSKAYRAGAPLPSPQTVWVRPAAPGRGSRPSARGSVGDLRGRSRPLPASGSGPRPTRCVAAWSNAPGASRGPAAGPRGSRAGAALSCWANVGPHSRPPAGGLRGKGVTPAPDRTWRGQTLGRTLPRSRLPRSVTLEARHDDLLDDAQ